MTQILPLLRTSCMTLGISLSLRFLICNTRIIIVLSPSLDVRMKRDQHFHEENIRKILANTNLFWSLSSLWTDGHEMDDKKTINRRENWNQKAEMTPKPESQALNNWKLHCGCFGCSSWQANCLRATAVSCSSLFLSCSFPSFIPNYCHYHHLLVHTEHLIDLANGSWILNALLLVSASLVLSLSTYII